MDYGQLLGELRALLAKAEGSQAGAEARAAAPPAPGWFRITPTGVNANGAFHDYPSLEVSQSSGMTSYATNLAHNMRPPVISQSTAVMFGFGQTPDELQPLVAAGMKASAEGRTHDAELAFAEALDRWEHRVEWMNQAEADRYAAAMQANQGAAWVPSEKQQTATGGDFEPVPKE